MLIGDPVWGCVSVETAGVPHGRAWGQVDWFARKCSENGLILAWSRAQECFMVFTRHGQRWICQEIFKTSLAGVPVPLTPKAFWLLMWMWDRCKYVKSARIRHYREQKQRDQKADAYREMEQEYDDMRGQVMDKVAVMRGWRTPHAFADLQAAHRQSKKVQQMRKRRKRRRRVRLVLPNEAN